VYTVEGATTAYAKLRKFVHGGLNQKRMNRRVVTDRDSKVPPPNGDAVITCKETFLQPHSLLILPN
jgi:hypothetical protein